MPDKPNSEIAIFPKDGSRLIVLSPDTAGAIREAIYKASDAQADVIELIDTSGTAFFVNRREVIVMVVKEVPDGE